MVIFQSYFFPAAPLLRITPEHYTNIGKNDTLFRAVTNFRSRWGYTKNSRGFELLYKSTRWFVSE